MEIPLMGKPVVAAKIENLHDALNKESGTLELDEVPLELLDFVVDPIGQRLIGNPEHGGEHMIEMY